MAKGLYQFRCEDFSFDQPRLQATGGPPFNLLLSIYYKVDDYPMQLGVSMPIAAQIYGGTRVDLGRWPQTDPIVVDDESIISVIYQVVNFGEGYPSPFGPGFQEFNQYVLPEVSAIAGAFDIPVGPWVTIVEAALNFIYGSSGVPNCSGLVHLHQDQYLGARLVETTTNYNVHRISNTPSVPLPNSGCGIPASRVSLAVERVPALIAAAAPPRSSDPSFILTYTTSHGPTTAIKFDPANPPGPVEPGFTLHEPIRDSVSCIAPGGGSHNRLTPIHLFAVAKSGADLLHGWLDETGWHDWHVVTPAPTDAVNVIAVPSPSSTVDIFVANKYGNIYHGSLAPDGTFGVWDFQPVDQSTINPYQPTFDWGPDIKQNGVWGSTQGFNIVAGMQPIGDEDLDLAQTGHRVAGGLVAFSSFKHPNHWTARTAQYDGGHPYSFKAIAPNTVVPLTDPGGSIELFAIGHDGAVYTSLAGPGGSPPLPTEWGGTLTFLGNDTNVLYPIPGPPAKELAAAQNHATKTVWVTYIGTDQKCYIAAFLWLEGLLSWVYPAQSELLPLKGRFSEMGGDFIGRPLIVPDPTLATRTFFFALGRNNKIYWKYCDQAEGAGPDEAVFTPRGQKWAGPLNI
jgi:hypothetical protein